MTAWRCIVLVTWQAGLEAGRGRGQETMDCRGILGNSKWRLVIMFSFWRSPLTGNFRAYNGNVYTLGTAIGLNMNDSFYADSVNAAAWNKSRLSFRVGCVLPVMYSCRFMKSTRLESFQRDRGIYGKRLRFTSKASIGTGKEQYMVRKANFKLVSYPNAIGKTLSLICQT